MKFTEVEKGTLWKLLTYAKNKQNKSKDDTKKLAYKIIADTIERDIFKGTTPTTPESNINQDKEHVTQRESNEAPELDMNQDLEHVTQREEPKHKPINHTQEKRPSSKVDTIQQPLSKVPVIPYESDLILDQEDDVSNQPLTTQEIPDISEDRKREKREKRKRKRKRHEQRKQAELAMITEKGQEDVDICDSEPQEDVVQQSDCDEVVVEVENNTSDQEHDDQSVVNSIMQTLTVKTKAPTIPRHCRKCGHLVKGNHKRGEIICLNGDK